MGGKPGVSTTDARLTIVPHSRQEMHRSGWRYAIDALASLLTEDGVLFDGFAEESHSWDLERNLAAKAVPYDRPWVGFIHNPPGMPQWYNYRDSPQHLLARPATQASLQHCLGLFTLSEYLADWLRGRVAIPVSTLTFPTETAVDRFDFARYRANGNKTLVQIGYWLRRLFSIQLVPTQRLTKLWLVPKPQARQFRDEVERPHVDPGPTVGTYLERDWIDHQSYDELLSRNVVFVDYYDASASNAIIECIVRATPILVNRLPAVEEYLGSGYPLYFRDLNHAARLAEDEGALLEAHLYLAALDLERFTAAYFLHSFRQSEVYRGL